MFRKLTNGVLVAISLTLMFVIGCVVSAVRWIGITLAWGGWFLIGEWLFTGDMTAKSTIMVSVCTGFLFGVWDFIHGIAGKAKEIKTCRDSDGNLSITFTKTWESGKRKW